MRLENIIKNGSYFSFYVLEPNDGLTAQVSYDPVSAQVLCLFCKREEQPCEHIKFLQRVLDKNSTASTAYFIRDLTDWLPSPEFISSMQRSFYNKTLSRPSPQYEFTPPKGWTEYLNWDAPDQKSKKPKSPSSPFSLIELD